MLLFKGLRCSDSSHERCYLTGGRVLFFMVDSETSQPPSAASPEGSSWRGARSPLPDFVPGINRMQKLRQTVCIEELEVRGRLVLHRR